MAMVGAQEAVMMEEATATDATESLDLDEMLAEADATVAGETDAEVPVVDNASEAAEATEEATAAGAAAEGEEEAAAQAATAAEPEQSGPFIDLLGPHLYELEMIDETQAQLVPQYTNEALKGKKVVGLYFSADWCGPCRYDYLIVLWTLTKWSDLFCIL